MNLLNEIRSYTPANQQEEYDMDLMIQYLLHNPDCLERKNRIAHFTASIWTINREKTKTLMA